MCIYGVSRTTYQCKRKIENDKLIRWSVFIVCVYVLAFVRLTKKTSSNKSNDHRRKKKEIEIMNIECSSFLFESKHMRIHR